MLFRSLQAETASALGMDAVWLVAANTIGATADQSVLDEVTALENVIRVRVIQ